MKEYGYSRGGPNWILFLISVVFSLYFLNAPFQIFKIPESWAIAEPWILFVGGILIIFGIVNSFRARRNNRTY